MVRIGIDIDGVLTDIEKWQLEVGSKYFEKYNKKIVNNKGYEISEIFDVSKELDYKFWEDNLFEYATKEQPRKYAGEVISKLKEDGYEIYIVTARYLTDQDTELGERMRNIVKCWLKENDIYYDNIIFSPDDKLETCKENKINIMIEDKVANINNISSIIPVICFNAGYNKSCTGTNIYRAYTWYDVYNKIKDELKLSDNG